MSALTRSTRVFWRMGLDLRHAVHYIRGMICANTTKQPVVGVDEVGEGVPGDDEDGEDGEFGDHLGRRTARH